MAVDTARTKYGPVPTVVHRSIAPSGRRAESAALSRDPLSESIDTLCRSKKLIIETISTTSRTWCHCRRHKREPLPADPQRQASYSLSTRQLHLQLPPTTMQTPSHSRTPQECLHLDPTRRPCTVDCPALCTDLPLRRTSPHARTCRHCQTDRAERCLRRYSMTECRGNPTRARRSQISPQSSVPTGQGWSRTRCPSTDRSTDRSRCTTTAAAPLVLSTEEVQLSAAEFDDAARRNDSLVQSTDVLLVLIASPPAGSTETGRARECLRPTRRFPMQQHG